MDRDKAICVLREILPILQRTDLAYFMFNETKQENAEHKQAASYQIKIKCTLNCSTRRELEPILKAHKLTLKETDGFVIISSKT